jgi:hypothetical protein
MISVTLIYRVFQSRARIAELRKSTAETPSHGETVIALFTALRLFVSAVSCCEAVA